MENPFILGRYSWRNTRNTLCWFTFPIDFALTSVFLKRWEVEKDAALISAPITPIGGCDASIPVVATGLLAWRFQLRCALKGNLLLHLVFGAASR